MGRFQLRPATPLKIIGCFYKFDRARSQAGVKVELDYLEGSEPAQSS
jgi:hypothetical protein